MTPTDEASAVFRVVPHGKDRWMAVGYVDNNEVWADGCCIQDKALAGRIALNMQVSFEAGVKWATARVATNLAGIKPPPTQPVSYEIVVNGNTYPWAHRSIMLDDLNDLLKRDPAYRYYSTTYRGGCDPKPDGIFNHGDCAPVRNGMVFNSYDTSNA